MSLNGNYQGRVRRTHAIYKRFFFTEAELGILQQPASNHYIEIINFFLSGENIISRPRLEVSYLDDFYAGSANSR